MQKSVSIFINGQKKELAKKRLSYAELLHLAFNTDPNPHLLFTITYRHGPEKHPEGSVLRDGKITVVNGMVFNVHATGNA